MFALMDTDNDGKVTYEELRAGLRKVGSQLAEQEIRMLMEVVNTCVYHFLCSNLFMLPFSFGAMYEKYHVLTPLLLLLDWMVHASIRSHCILKILSNQYLIFYGYVKLYGKYIYEKFFEVSSSYLCHCVQYLGLYITKLIFISNAC